MQDGTFKREIGHDERDTLHTRTFIIHLFKSKAVMYKQQIESNTTEYEQGLMYRHSHLYSFYL